jgi:hypothetical protein
VAVKAGLLVESNAKLEYEGPQDPMALAEDPEFRLRVAVKVKQDRVMRTRPRFAAWSAEVTLKYQPALLDADVVRRFLPTMLGSVWPGDARRGQARYG